MYELGAGLGEPESVDSRGHHLAELHVLPEQESGQWEVHWEGHVVASFNDKRDAVEDGRGRAIGPLPAELVVHADDGRVESRQPYP